MTHNSPNCKKINLAWNISILIGVWLWISCSSCNVQLVCGDLDYFLGLVTYSVCSLLVIGRHLFFLLRLHFLVVLHISYRCFSSWQKKRWRCYNTYRHFMLKSLRDLEWVVTNISKIFVKVLILLRFDWY